MAVGITGRMRSRGEIVEESPPAGVAAEDKMYVAVGKDVKKSKMTLRWALHNSGGRKICVLHVHQPSQKIPILGPGTGFSISQLEEEEVKAFHAIEKEAMHALLDKYIWICDQAGAQADSLYIEADSIEKGIVELASRHGIGKLVMGAAADKRYSRRMREPRSRKAIYVRQQAPVSCQILFICKGNLIYTRQAILNSESGQSSSMRSRSTAEGHNNESRLATDYRRVRSDNHGMMLSVYSPPNASGVSTRRNTLVAEAIDNGLEPYVGNHAPIEVSMNDEIYDRLLEEVENSRREAYEESIRRRKAEKKAIEAIRRAKTSETLYAEEFKQRKEIEEALKSGKEEVEKMKQHLDEVMEELRLAQEQKSSLDNEIANSEKFVQELEQKIFSAVELLQKYKKERDELHEERDNVLREARELRRKKAEEGSSTKLFAEFSFSEIEEATRNFDPALKIGEGGYGNIYRGILRHTHVAIKMPKSRSSKVPSEFKQEVDVLSKLRHPNLITLIGACPEAWILVYEYLPNGSLEDRLCCKGNTPPLSWQTRIRIAAELCCVLIFLHSSTPRRIVHGDLKPANILLDANYVSKLSDFGICRVISDVENSSNNNTSCRITEPKGTLGYVDPEFVEKGELTVKSDVYSFGVILLRLLTGRPAVQVTREVQYALAKGNLKDLLDPTAGDWPFCQAKQLAHLAMGCCERNRENRPDLFSEIWTVLEPMKVLCGGLSSRLGYEGNQDPVVVADGFTYEAAEALRRWLDGGRDTSPMTIQEWLQQA